MRLRLSFIAALALLSLPVAAQNNEIGASYAAVRYDKVTAEDTEIRFHQAHGWAVDYNRYWFGGLSTDFSYTSVSSKGRLLFQGQQLFDLGSVDAKIYSATVQWHLAPHGKLDPYIGAGYARLNFDDLSSNDLTTAGAGTIHIDDSNGFVGNAGLTLNLHPHIGVAMDLKYVSAKPKAGEDRIELDVTPWVASAGVRFRF
jgi:opacity protein-like surface antigen